MAFTVTARHVYSAGQTTGTSITSGTATPTADSLLIWTCGAQGLDQSDPRGGVLMDIPTGGGLTWTERVALEDDDVTNSYTGSNNYFLSGTLATAPVGGSPSSFAISQGQSDGPVTGASTAIYWSGVAVNVTGHNTTTPIVAGSAVSNQTSNTGGNTNLWPISITLNSTPTTGNLVVVGVIAGADGGGGFSAPYAGASGNSDTFTEGNETEGVPGYVQSGIFYRVWDGTESSNVITIDDIGQSIGNGVVFAIEIAADAGGDATVTPATVAATTAVPAPTVEAGATVTPASVAATAAFPAPSIAGGSAATVTPATIAATTTVPAPTVTAGNAATVTPPPVAAATTIGAPSVTVPTVIRERQVSIILSGECWHYSDPAVLV